jgi:hypothetical protein
MVPEVFSLHTIIGTGHLEFPFSIKDYQRYVFGDDTLAHQFGTDLAKAFIARGPNFGASQSTNIGTSNQRPANDVTVAVLSGRVPTATHRLREHFTTHLNDYLNSINSRLARKVEITGGKNGNIVSEDSSATKTKTYHIDRTSVAGSMLVILGDIRMSQNQEDIINKSLATSKIDTTVIFAYLATLDDPTRAAALSPILYSIASPTSKDIENIVQSPNFTMNETIARYVLGFEYIEFCRFLRAQQDSFVKALRDYVVDGALCGDELFKSNLTFLLWECSSRESI